MMSHEHYMARCLELAQRAKGYTSPNPMVGALLVHNDRIIGEGWHHYYGADHAEVNCLANVRDEDRHLIAQSTMYVNLEPCAHYGLTPPCAIRLVQEQVKNVVIANRDPFAKVNGKGIAMLQDAGINVVTGVMEAEGQWVNRRFFCAHTHKRPYVILKWAQSADGFIGTTHHTAVQISSPASMQLSHRWRTEEGAIMVGHTTALNDNPRLTARLHTGKQPLRIVLDRQLTLPPSHHLFGEEAATWVVNEKDETISGNIHYIKIPFNDGLLPALMQRLYDAHIPSLLVEGGATLHGSLIEQGLWDEARTFTSTQLNMTSGLPAPLVQNAWFAHSAPSGTDILDVHINNANTYRFVAGMEL